MPMCVGRSFRFHLLPKCAPVGLHSTSDFTPLPQLVVVVVFCVYSFYTRNHTDTLVYLYFVFVYFASFSCVLNILYIDSVMI